MKHVVYLRMKVWFCLVHIHTYTPEYDANIPEISAAWYMSVDPTIKYILGKQNHLTIPGT